MTAPKNKPIIDTTSGSIVSAKWSGYKLRVVVRFGRKRKVLLIHRGDLARILEKAEADAREKLALAKDNLEATRGTP